MLGISPRRFWGWEPRETHRIIRTGNRTVGHEVEREAEWNDADRALVLALQRYTDSLGPHGFPMEDVVSELADPTNPEAEYGYVAGVPTRMPDGSLRDMPVIDQARKAQQDAEDAYRELVGPDAPMNGVFFPVRRVARTPPKT